MGTLTSQITGKPRLTVTGGASISEMTVEITVNWVDGSSNTVATTSLDIPVWDALSAQQKIDMQGIRDTVASYVVGVVG